MKPRFTSSVRRAGLAIVVAILRLFTRPPVAGWQRSRRPTDLRGR